MSEVGRISGLLICMFLGREEEEEEV